MTLPDRETQTPKPEVYDKVMYLGIAALITIPMPVLVALDLPKRNDLLWQFMVFVNAFFWPYTQVSSHHRYGIVVCR